MEQVAVPASNGRKMERHHRLSVRKSKVPRPRSDPKRARRFAVANVCRRKARRRNKLRDTALRMFPARSLLRPQIVSGTAVGGRGAAQSVLDAIEHGGILPLSGRAHSPGAPTEDDTLSLFGFLQRKPSAALRTAAGRELLEARDACRKVFDRNMTVLLRDCDSLTDMIVLAPAYDYRGFNDLFLKGLVDAFMDGRPPLPTEPTDRALLHMAAYLAERESISLADGLSRANTAKQRYTNNHSIFDAFVEAGRLAYREDSDHRLAETSRRIRNNMIIDNA